MAIFARLTYAFGADVLGLLTARFVLAGTILTLLMWVRGRRWPRGRSLVVAIGMGGIGYVGQAACFFAALNHASAGLVALLLYAYPTLVCILAALFLHQPLTRARVALLAMSFAGIALTLGGGHGTATGFALGLGAAAFYSVYIVVGARELTGVDSLAATTVVCLAAAATLLAACAFREPHFPAAWQGWTALAALVLVSTLVAMLSFFAGLKRVGPATASIVSTLEPVVTVALAWLVLGESIAPVQLAGGALVSPPPCGSHAADPL